MKQPTNLNRVTLRTVHAETANIWPVVEICDWRDGEIWQAAAEFVEGVAVNLDVIVGDPDTLTYKMNHDTSPKSFKVLLSEAFKNFAR